MSILPLRFRNMAAQTKITDFGAKDVSWNILISTIASNLTQYFLRAIENRIDLNDIISVWGILGIDALVRLENADGGSFRVAVALRNHHNKAYSIYRMAQQPAMVKIRHLLNIHHYWIFSVEEKRFPSQEKWLELLHENIDVIAENNSCKLINL